MFIPDAHRGATLKAVQSHARITLFLWSSHFICRYIDGDDENDGNDCSDAVDDDDDDDGCHINMMMAVMM